MKKLFTCSLAFCLSFGAMYAQSTLFTMFGVQQFSVACFAKTPVTPQSNALSQPAVAATPQPIKAVKHEDLIRPLSPVDTVQEVGHTHRIVVRIGNETVESNVFAVSHEFDFAKHNNDLPLATFERERSHLVLSTED